MSDSISLKVDISDEGIVSRAASGPGNVSDSVGSLTGALIHSGGNFELDDSRNETNSSGIIPTMCHLMDGASQDPTSEAIAVSQWLLSFDIVQC